MKARTEELLYLLLWSCETLSRPTLRNLDESFEAWAYRRGLWRQLAALERRRFVESEPVSSAHTSPDERAVRLTQAGRLHALGGRDPETRWNRSWDGRWRLVVFDLPNAQATLRNRLRRELRRRGFGGLQNSVWISPDPLDEEIAPWAGLRTDVESLVLLEARPCAGETDEEIVKGAWDFEAINSLYSRYRQVLARRPPGRVRHEGAARSLREWATQERQAWLAAVTMDPLLPACLLPSDYLGRATWHERVEALGAAAAQVREFRHSDQPIV